MLIKAEGYKNRRVKLISNDHNLLDLGRENEPKVKPERQEGEPTLAFQEAS